MNKPEFNPSEPFDDLGSLPNQALTAVEGLASGATLGGSKIAETKLLGVNPQEIQGREEANPVTSFISNIGGSAALLSATGGLGLGAEAGAGLSSLAASGAAQGAIIGAANSVSNDLAFGDPNLAASKIASHAGLSALYGGAIGGVGSTLIDGASIGLKNISRMGKAFGSPDLSISPDALSPLQKIRVGLFTGTQGPEQVVNTVSDGLNSLNDLATMKNLNELSGGSSGPEIEAFDSARKDFLKQFGKEGANEQATNGGATRQVEMGEPLPDLPKSSLGPNQTIQGLANEYSEASGVPYQRQAKYVNINPENSSRIAQAFEAMEHNPADPRVKASYDALIKETLDQYQTIKKSGLKIDAIEAGQSNPYPNGSKDFLKDIRDNNHLWFFPTEQGFGSSAEYLDHPMLSPTSEVIGDRPLLANDVFRIVHDIFGHAKEGVGIGPAGEENAWLSHSGMYSDLAKKALTTETRGQNSWVNFGPHGEANRLNPLSTIYADQKAGLLPDWIVNQANRPSAQSIDSKKILSFITNPKDKNSTAQTVAFNHFFKAAKGLSQVNLSDQNLNGSLKKAQANLEDWLGLLPYANATQPEVNIEYGSGANSKPYNTNFGAKSTEPGPGAKPGVTIQSEEGPARVSSFGNPESSPYESSFNLREGEFDRGPSIDLINSKIKEFQHEILKGSTEEGVDASSEDIKDYLGLAKKGQNQLSNIANASNAIKTPRQGGPLDNLEIPIAFLGNPKILAAYEALKYVQKYSGEGGWYRLGNTLVTPLKILDGAAHAVHKTNEKIGDKARLIFTGTSSQARKINHE